MNDHRYCAIVVENRWAGAILSLKMSMEFPPSSRGSERLRMRVGPIQRKGQVFFEALRRLNDKGSVGNSSTANRR